MNGVAALGDVCQITMGQAPSGDSYNDQGEGLPLVAGAGDFAESTPSVKKFTTAPGKVSREGDIILGIRASIGERVWSDRPYCLGRGVAGLRPSETLDRNYLWHWLGHSADRLKAKGRGATFLQVSRADINEMEIPLPPLAEQRRIAAILDQADTDVRKSREAQVRLSHLTQSVFADMFGEPGRANNRWPIKRLADLTENQDSVRVPLKVTDRSSRQGPYPYYGASGIIDTIDDYLFDGDRLLVSEDGANLLARSSPIAFVASGRFWVNNHAHVLAPTGAAELRYLEAAIARLDIKEWLTGSTQPKLTRSALDRIELASPPIALQTDFVHRIASIDRLKALNANMERLLGTLMASLQSRAFSGRL